MSDKYSVKKISQIESSSDILRLSAASTPGSHCPLFGVVMCAPFISDLAIIVLGETECCWNATNQHLSQGENNIFYTYCLDEMDVIYGVEQGLTAAIQDLYKKQRFAAVMIVSSCIPELTGEDIEKISQNCNLPVQVLVAHTSHYNSTGYYQGIINFYNGLFPLISSVPSPNRNVAILGARYKNVESSEIPLALRENGFGVYAPKSITDIKSLSSCALNLVVDVTALSFAEQIYSAYGVPFVRIDHLCCPDKILKAYSTIDSILGSALLPSAQVQFKKTYKKALDIGGFWSTKRFICAAPFCLPFEMCEFFCSIGLIPEWLLARDIYSGDSDIINRLTKAGFDPPVSSFASFGNFEEILSELNFNLYFGNTRNISKIGTKALIINPNLYSSMTGFAFPLAILSEMETYAKGVHTCGVK